MRGKVFSYAIFDKNDKDHPRLCGEKESNPSSVGVGPGSPPPMRGKVIKAKE